MKRLAAIGVSVCMLFALLPLAVFGADEDTGLTKAILTAKERIEVPESYTEFSSETQEADGVTYYSLEWSPKPDDMSNMRAQRLRIEISDRGDILNYQKNYASYEKENQFAKYSGEELRDMAYAWLQKVNPEAVVEFPIENAEFTEGYSVSSVVNVRFDRFVGGVPFCGDYFNILLNTQTGEVTSLYSQYTYYQELPAADTVIEQEKAQEKFWTLNPLSAKYVTSAEENKAVLVYAPKDSNFEMDAVTGEEVIYEDKQFYNTSKEASVMEEDGAVAGGGSNRLSESELKNVEQIKGLLSKDALISIAKGLENTGFVSAEAEAVYYNLIREEGKEDRYYASVALKVGTGHGNVRLDAKTGELISLYSYREADAQEKETVDRAAAEKTAAAFAEKYAKDAFARCKVSEIDEQILLRNQEKNSIHFIRYENEIPYDSNSIHVEVDGVTGQINYFSKIWNDEMVFEDPSGLVGEETAKAALLGEGGLSLKYLNKKRGDGIGEIVFAYVLDRFPAYVGGTNGKLVNYDGSIYEETAGMVMPEDIAGHYGETAITMLIQAGILGLEEESREFRPDEIITQKELLAFVGGLMNGRIPHPIADAEAMRIAVRYGIFAPEDYQPNKEACRLEGVEYILHALDYAEIADLQGIYDSGFADREAMVEKEGYAAIAKGLGIVSGDENGYFLPYEPLTRADAAIMIYNYFMR